MGYTIGHQTPGATETTPIGRVLTPSSGYQNREDGPGGRVDLDTVQDDAVMESTEARQATDIYNLRV